VKASVIILDAHRAGFPIVDVNQACMDLTGYSREELIGKSCTIFQGKDSDPDAVRKCHEALERGRTTTVEILNYRKDGSSFWNEVMFNPVFDDEGEIQYFIILHNDITERKQVERRLKESKQRYKSLFEHNPEFICAIHSDGIITSANPAVENITGYKIHEVLHHHYQYFIAEADREKAINYFYRAVKRSTQRVNLKVIHKNGDLIDLEVVAVPIVIEGRLEGIYVITKDVTEMQKAEEMLRRVEKLNVVSELAAGIAHEIRNPLTSLKGFVQLLRPSLENKKAHTYTDVMLSELERIEQIVTELLLLAKPQSTEFKEKNLRDLLDHVCTLMNTKAIMSNTEIILDYRCETSCIYCEENQLKQVIINLLKNAIEAMPSGGEIRLEAEDAGDDCIVIRVVDQGCGIPEENLPKLGEPFYTTKEQGTGLGLMISSKIIREHGGDMQFKNNQGEGTTVEITLPVSPEVTKDPGNKYQITG
jgi:PAS domain S-box-containing protein